MIINWCFHEVCLRYFLFFTVNLLENLFSHWTGNRDFLMGIRTRSGLFLWSLMRVELDIENCWSSAHAFFLFLNMMHQKFKSCNAGIIFVFPLEWATWTIDRIQLILTCLRFMEVLRNLIYVNKSGICWLKWY